MNPIVSYLPVLAVLLLAGGLAAAIPQLTTRLGPKSVNPIKSEAFECGNPAIGSARQRFAVKFYVVALLFIVFDVEAVFLYPWAVTFPNIAAGTPESLTWLIRILFFLLTTVVAYLYGYRKGVFKFD